MAQGKSSGSDGDMNFFIIIGIVIIVVIFGVAMIYSHNKALINQTVYFLTQLQLLPFLPFSHVAQGTWRYMQAHPAATNDWDHMRALLSVGGSFGRWFMAPFIAWSGWLAYQNVGTIQRFTRQFTMKTLLQHNAKLFPALAPVAFREKLVSDESTSIGPWRVIESPMLFAIRNKIIKDKEGNLVAEGDCFTSTGVPRVRVRVPKGGFVFDEKRAIDVYEKRIGPKFPGIQGLLNQPRYIRGLIGALCAVAIGKKEDGGRILDAMSSSFNESVAVASQNEKEIPGDFVIDIADADKFIERAFRKRSAGETDVESDLALALIDKLSNHSVYLYVWMAELLHTARMQGGATPANEFIWLRPSNRPLWYLLTAVGGNTVSPEGAACWAHRDAEKVLGGSIGSPAIETAAYALLQSIDDEGWIEAESVNEIQSSDLFESNDEQKPKVKKTGLFASLFRSSRK